MRVMHVITGLGGGGAETALTRLVLAERPVPMNQRVVSLTGGGRYAAVLSDGGIPVDILRMQRGQFGIGGIFRLARLIRRHSPDVVQSWMYHADLAALLGLAISGRRHRTRLYWGLRAANMSFEKYGPLLRHTFKICAWLSPLPNGIVANSRSGRSHHAAQGYHPRLFALIRNGVDCVHFAPMPDAGRSLRAELGVSPERVVVTHLARVDPMKDHPSLLAALERTPQVTCLALGKGTEGLPRLSNLVPLGEISDVRPTLAAADIVVSSSIGEGFPNALAEGMAMGLPAVATDVGDTAEIVGQTGIIVPPGEPDALAAAISELAGDPDRRTSLGRAARMRIESRFSLDAMVTAFDHLHRTGRMADR